MRAESGSRHLSPPTKAAGACFKNRRVSKPGTVEGTLVSLYATDILFWVPSAGPGPLDLERDHVDEH